ncbi:hypothetical protein E2P81_ATG11406 [Venturia nashicola]|nr:hypothetical protein E2P81_ATG11406 [Venturia nashicola]
METLHPISQPNVKMRLAKWDADVSLGETKKAVAALTKAYKFSNGLLATWLVTAAVDSGYEFGPYSRHRIGYINTNEYVGLAQHLSAQSDLSIPVDVIDRLDWIISLRTEVRNLHQIIRRLEPKTEDFEADAGHQAFIETLARVRTELKSDSLTPASATFGLSDLSLDDKKESESLDEANPEPLPKILKEKTASVWQSMKDDKVRAKYALQDLFSTLKSFEKEIISLWEAFHDSRSESQLVIAAVTTVMAMNLVTALELEFNELYKNCNLTSLAQELHVEACKEQGQPNLHDFIIDLKRYTIAESYYIPHLWMSTLLDSNWTKVVRDVKSGKAVSRSFDDDERKLFQSPDFGPLDLDDESKENQGRCAESLKFGYRTIHRVLSSLSILKTVKELVSKLWPAPMDPLIQMIAEKHIQPLAFAFTMRLQEKVKIIVRTDSVPVCENARLRMLGIIDSKTEYNLAHQKDFTPGPGIEIWMQRKKLLDACEGLLHETITPEDDELKIRRFLFEDFPLASGLSLACYKYGYHGRCVRFIREDQIVSDAAHLYIMVKWHQGASVVEWPEMEDFLHMHASQLFGSRTNSDLTNFSDRWMFYATCGGQSAAWIQDLTSNRNKNAPPVNRDRIRRADQITPIMEHFLDHDCGNEGVSLEELSRILQKKHAPDEHWAKMAEPQPGVKVEEEKVTDTIEAEKKKKASEFDHRSPEESGEDVPLAIELLHAFRDEFQKEERITHFEYLAFHDQCFKYLSDIRDRLSQPDLFPHRKHDGGLTNNVFREGFMGVFGVANTVLDMLDEHVGRTPYFNLTACFRELRRITAEVSPNESSEEEELEADQTEQEETVEETAEDKARKEKKKKNRKNKNARRREKKKKLRKQGDGGAEGAVQGGGDEGEGYDEED